MKTLAIGLLLATVIVLPVSAQPTGSQLEKTMGALVVVLEDPNHTPLDLCLAATHAKDGLVEALRESPTEGLKTMYLQVSGVVKENCH